VLRTMLAAAAITALAVSPALAQAARTATPSTSIQGNYDASNDPSRFDLDHDGELSLAEAKSAAAFRFDKLDPDHDGTLSPQELGNRVSTDEFKRANPDNDGTLDKAEYLRLVEARYRAASGGADHGIKIGTLSTTDAGKRLLQLMQ
jgi:EF hand